VTVKMMNQDGTFLPGEMTQDLGYVSNLIELEQTLSAGLLLILHFKCEIYV